MKNSNATLQDRSGARHGFFSDLFGARRDIDALLNPTLKMKLPEFAVIEDDPQWLKHYFRYTNSDGQNEEFITVYQRHGSEAIYSHTHSRRLVWGKDFVTLGDRSPWSPTIISHLIREGENLARKTCPTRGHLASQIPAALEKPDRRKPRRHLPLHPF